MPCSRNRTPGVGVFAFALTSFVTTALAHASAGISITPIGTYASGIFDESAAEIVAHDPGSQRLFVVSAASGMIDVIDIRDPSQPLLLFQIDLSDIGSAANSVDVHRGLIAVAVEDQIVTNNGKAAFFDADGTFIAAVEVGALPDMITFTPNGKHVLVANEGEPSSDYAIDPEGTVSIIDLPRHIRRLSQAHVRTADFRRFNDAALDPSIRIFGPGATVAQDLEPEYISVDKTSRRAWIALQENNAIAELDIRSGKITRLKGLGFKDHNLPGNELDPSDRDNAIAIGSWPVFGMYQPDAMASFEHHGRTYLVTANEGDARDYDGFSEESRINDLLLDPGVFPAELQRNENLGRLTVTTSNGLNADTGYFEALYAFGARSFSIWNDRLELVYDSGADIERITANANPEFFNSNNTSNNFEGRSDDKGPEPEAIGVAKLWGRTYAFVGLERIGGIIVYDISNPHTPTFVQYFNNRNFDADTQTPEAGDLAPEGVKVIEAHDSPISGVPLLAVGNEVSGTTTLYRIERESRFGHCPAGKRRPFAGSWLRHLPGKLFPSGARGVDLRRCR
jgi:hypothetical protein